MSLQEPHLLCSLQKDGEECIYSSDEFRTCSVGGGGDGEDT
jgi:hypothetical protein